MEKLTEDILSKKIDINNQELFVRSVLKGLMRELNESIMIRDKYVPHMIINTGDDKMYLAVKGQDFSIEPAEVSNESYVYNTIPRCIVTPGSLNLLFDQLTSPYTKGRYEIDTEDGVYSYVAEFRRMPMKLGVNLKYYLNTFTDALDITQKFITHLHIIQNYVISYMGQSIMCTYRIADSYDVEANLEFDGLSAESKFRTVSIELEVETNMPIYYPETSMPADSYIHELPRMVVRTPGNTNLEIENDEVLSKENEIKIETRSGIYPSNKTKLQQ